MGIDISEHKYLFHKGKNYKAYEFLGAHREGKGYLFRVWAPRAVSVSLVGDFNSWDTVSGRMHRLEDDDSIWEILENRASSGDLYKFAIYTDTGKVLYKADPFAFFSEEFKQNEGSRRASVIWDTGDGFEWHDSAMLKNRRETNLFETPVNIYEVHLGSWRHRPGGDVYNYREIADLIIPYAIDMGYTHLEILPIMEHPYDGSWGYQITGYYSVTSRYGTPDDFKYLVDKAHKARIGIILDWVPAHFPKDEYGLVKFDGHYLYEYTDPLKREHKEWGTMAFDYGRPEVVSFLTSSAFFFCDEYHVDGIRVDAVAAMIYLDYGRNDGEWSPNKYGGNENKEAISFLQELNHNILTNYPGVMMIAEESTAWPNVTKPPETGGLGFNFKWNMGWMNDAVEYFSTPPDRRGGIHNKLTFSISYAYSENFILPLSHDEVVHGKCSLIGKMPGDYDDKFATLRCFFVYVMTHPGKKLMFMGSEFAQFIEWDEKRELDWLLLDYEMHRQFKTFVRDINAFYLECKALWERDDTYDGFDWIDADNYKDSVYTYLRSGAEGKRGMTAIIALNLGESDFEEYNIGVPDALYYNVKVNTDSEQYGGRNKDRLRKYYVIRGAVNGFDQHITVRLPRRSAIILEKR